MRSCGTNATSSPAPRAGARDQKLRRSAAAAAVNAKVLDHRAIFAPEQRVSPKKLSESEKVARWSALRFLRNRFGDRQVVRHAIRSHVTYVAGVQVNRVRNGAEQGCLNTVEQKRFRGAVALRL